MFQPMVCPEHLVQSSDLPLGVQGEGACLSPDSHTTQPRLQVLTRCSGSDQWLAKGCPFGFHHCGDHMVVQAPGQSG